MALYNVFSPKKPKYQASGYGSQYAQSGSIMPSGTTSASATLRKPTTSTFNYVTPTKPSTPYSASGMTSQYATNPTNYVAPTLKQPEKTDTSPSVGSSYLNTLQQSGDAQKALAEKQRQDQENYAKQQYSLLNQGLDNSAGQYQTAFNDFKTNSAQNVKDIQASGETQKANAKDYYGDAQLQAAKSRNEVRGQTQRTFANLNTLDSRGEGSFGQATENQDSAFNSFTQGNLKAQAQRLSEIDMEVGKATRHAELAVQQEASKLNGLLQQIQIAKSQNNLEQAKSLTNAYNQTQQRIYDIQDGINNIKYQYQLEQEKFQQAQNAIAQETKGLSPEFLQNGTVKTMQDFIYRSKHPNMYGKIAAVSPTAGNNQNKAITMVNNLLGESLGGITGGLRYSGVPFVGQMSGAATAQADYDGLKNLLALAERGQLKGSGAVSDFEARMLEKAALAGLNQNLPETEFRRRLEILKNDLQSGGATDSTQSGIDPAVAAYLQANGLQ